MIERSMRRNYEVLSIFTTPTKLKAFETSGKLIISGVETAFSKKAFESLEILIDYDEDLLDYHRYTFDTLLHRTKYTEIMV